MFDINSFNSKGFAGPFKLLEKKDCQKVLSEDLIPNSKMTWIKSAHEKSKIVRNLSKNIIIIKKIKEILGEDILLWSSCFINQKPNSTHGWHVDIEHIFWDGVTVWCGLKNLNNLTPLSIITHSHLINLIPQELKQKNIDTNNDDEILKYAKMHNTKCELKKLYLNEGEFIIWKGKLWHNTHNFNKKNRYSIILQYTKPEYQVKIPKKYNYPTIEWSEHKPICLLVNGKDEFKKNKLLINNKNMEEENLIDFINTKLIYKVRFLILIILKKILMK